jgi:hypothetical protein
LKAQFSQIHGRQRKSFFRAEPLEGDKINEKQDS